MFTGDVGSKIILGLLNNGTAYSIPSGVTVTIEGSESNGSIFTPISATASGSDITFYLTGEMTAVAGPAICQAVLKSGSDILGTANFTLEVESSPMGADAPPVFTDAGWTWMLNKLTTEFVPALGDNIIDAIDSKLGKNQGTANAGKYLKVGADGNVETADLDVTTDKTLSIADKAADAKAVGDELDDLKADLTDTSDVITKIGDDSYFKTPISYDGYDTNRSLTSTGKDITTGSAILSFPVVAGEFIKVSLVNRTGGDILYFFQDQKTVPWDSNTHIIGGIHRGRSYAGYMRVPSGATYLVTNADMSNIVSTVESIGLPIMTDLKSVLEDISANIYTTKGFTYDKYWSSDGVEGSYVGAGHTDYIDVNANDAYNLSLIGDSTKPVKSAIINIIAFDSTKTFIALAKRYELLHGDNTAVSISVTFSLPTGTKYISISYGLMSIIASEPALTNVSKGDVTAIDNIARTKVDDVLNILSDKNVIRPITNIEIGSINIDNGEDYNDIYNRYRTSYIPVTKGCIIQLSEYGKLNNFKFNVFQYYTTSNYTDHQKYIGNVVFQQMIMKLQILTVLLSA